ncbi:UDP-N-acetylmuramate dehydrogenase [soil metagenome]
MGYFVAPLLTYGNSKERNMQPKVLCYRISMQVLTGVSLKLYSTMRLGGTAAYLKEVSTKQELVEALEWASAQSLPVIMIGQGSNIVWQDEGFQGLILVNKFAGFEQINNDDVSTTYTIGAGEDWDAIVGRLVSLGLSGVEGLSLIPGTVGATPVQNVGAYGAEISRVLLHVEAYDSQKKEFVIINNAECGFGYRTSRFKTIDKGRFFITSITLKLHKTLPKPPFYSTLKDYLDKYEIHEFTPQIIRDAVIAIRSDKMPDWHKIANNGSFFANPLVPKTTYEKLKLKFPELVGWQHGTDYKLSAGWLVEKTGLKGHHDAETGMATSNKTALVLINEHARSTADLLKFKEMIVGKVEDMFGITLEQEPELLP